MSEAGSRLSSPCRPVPGLPPWMETGVVSPRAAQNKALSLRVLRSALCSLVSSLGGFVFLKMVGRQ